VDDSVAVRIHLPAVERKRKVQIMIEIYAKKKEIMIETPLIRVEFAIDSFYRLMKMKRRKVGELHVE
jgi:hypothetical protein